MGRTSHQGHQAGGQGHHQEGGTAELGVMNARQNPRAETVEDGLDGRTSARRRKPWHEGTDLSRVRPDTVPAGGVDPLYPL